MDGNDSAFDNKYKDHTIKQLKFALKNLKKSKDNDLNEIRYISKIIRNKLKRAPIKTSNIICDSESALSSTPRQNSNAASDCREQTELSSAVELICHFCEYFS